MALSLQNATLVDNPVLRGNISQPATADFYGGNNSERKWEMLERLLH
jgi:hypothetical protein